MYKALSNLSEEFKPFTFEDRRPTGKPTLPPDQHYPDGQSPWKKQRTQEEYVEDVTPSRIYGRNSHAPTPPAENPLVEPQYSPTSPGEPQMENDPLSGKDLELRQEELSSPPSVVNKVNLQHTDMPDLSGKNTHQKLTTPEEKI